MTYNDKNFAEANKDASSGAEAYYVIIIFGLTVSRYKLTIYHFETQCASSPDMATI